MIFYFFEIVFESVNFSIVPSFYLNWPAPTAKVEGVHLQTARRFIGLSVVIRHSVQRKEV